MHTTGLKIYFDGGARPNPGMIETGVVVRGRFHHKTGLGPGDNNIAEWLGLLHALDIAKAMGERAIILIGDSALVIHQAKGEWPCRSAALQDHYDSFARQSADFDRIRLRHVGRSHNLAGIALANLHDPAKTVNPALCPNSTAYSAAKMLSVIG